MGQFGSEVSCHHEANPMQDMHRRVRREVNRGRGRFNLKWERDHSMETIGFAFKPLPLPQTVIECLALRVLDKMARK